MGSSADKVLKYSMGGVFADKLFSAPSAPDLPDMPSPTTTDVGAAEEMAKKRAAERKGRASTILTDRLGLNKTGKEVLG